jgi:DNA-binding response OmpR family regulator
MRKSAGWSAVPVIIASSAGGPSDRQAAAKLGISDYFRKPADLEEFMEIGAIVRRVVGT